MLAMRLIPRAQTLYLEKLIPVATAAEAIEKNIVGG